MSLRDIAIHGSRWFRGFVNATRFTRAKVKVAKIANFFVMYPGGRVGPRGGGEKNSELWGGAGSDK